MREGTARRLARAHVAAIDEADAAPITHTDRVSTYHAMDSSRMGYTLPPDVPTMRTLMELSRATTADNINTLVELRDSRKTPPAVRLGAVGMLLDRGYGRPHQSIAIADLTTPGKLDLSGFSADELREFEYLLTKATATKPAPRDVTPPAGGGIVPGSASDVGDDKQ